MRANDALSGLILIALAGTMIAYTATFPAFPGQRYGPALFPRLLGAGLILCGALLVWRGLDRRRQGQPWLALAPWTREPRRALAFALVVGGVLAYILLAETVGFIPLAAILLLALFLAFGVPPLRAVAVASAATILIHWFFASLMRVPLPRGWLDAVL